MPDLGQEPAAWNVPLELLNDSPPPASAGSVALDSRHGIGAHRSCEILDVGAVNDRARNTLGDCLWHAATAAADNGKTGCRRPDRPETPSLEVLEGRTGRFYAPTRLDSTSFTISATVFRWSTDKSWAASSILK
jgi:hypothetical protein